MQIQTNATTAARETRRSSAPSRSAGSPGTQTRNPAQDRAVISDEARGAGGGGGSTRKLARGFKDNYAPKAPGGSAQRPAKLPKALGPKERPNVKELPKPEPQEPKEPKGWLRRNWERLTKWF